MYRSERDCIKHLGSRLFIFRTWIIRQCNTVCVHKLADIVTSLWLEIIKLDKEWFNVILLCGTILEYHIWNKWKFESVKQVIGFLLTWRLLRHQLQQQTKDKYIVSSCYNNLNKSTIDLTGWWILLKRSLTKDIDNEDTEFNQGCFFLHRSWRYVFILLHSFGEQIYVYIGSVDDQAHNGVFPKCFTEFRDKNICH